MKTSQCRGCGRAIVWGHLANGRRVPLDAASPVYRIAPGDMVAHRVNGKEAAVPDDHGTYLVSHFATCQKAIQFSGSRKED